MTASGGSPHGVARLDGLLAITRVPDPDADLRISEALRRLAAVSPVALHVESDAGSITVMPDQESFPFDPAARPSQALLPAVRDLVEAVGVGAGTRVESTLRIQEFLGGTVLEGVFVFEEPVGIVLTARERACRPEERPTVEEPPISVRAESIARRYQWPILALAVLLSVVGFFGWRAGWFSFGGGPAGGSGIDAGPLEGVVAFESVRVRARTLVFVLRAGEEFERFDEVAKECGLRPGIFRAVLVKSGEPASRIVPLDLRRLGELREDLQGEDGVVIEIPYDGPSFDEVLICW